MLYLSAYWSVKVANTSCQWAYTTPYKKNMCGCFWAAEFFHAFCPKAQTNHRNPIYTGWIEYFRIPTYTCIVHRKYLRLVIAFSSSSSSFSYGSHSKRFPIYWSICWVKRIMLFLWPSEVVNIHPCFGIMMMTYIFSVFPHLHRRKTDSNIQKNLYIALGICYSEPVWRKVERALTLLKKMCSKWYINR